MIEFVTGNILDCPAEVLVNPVNCVGVMGRGLALQIRNVFPENFVAYKAACRRGIVRPGHVFGVEVGSPGLLRWIVNFPTKRHWRDRSRIEDIEEGLGDLVRFLREIQGGSVAVPALGCGLGGLDWETEVRPRIEKALGPMDEVRAFVFAPGGLTRD